MYDLNKKKFLNIKKKILTNKTEEPFNEVRLNFLEELLLHMFYFGFRQECVCFKIIFLI